MGCRRYSRRQILTWPPPGRFKFRREGWFPEEARGRVAAYRGVWTSRFHIRWPGHEFSNKTEPSPPPLASHLSSVQCFPTLLSGNFGGAAVSNGAAFSPVVRWCILSSSSSPDVKRRSEGGVSGDGLDSSARRRRRFSPPPVHALLLLCGVVCPVVDGLVDGTGGSGSLEW